ncbi:transcription factor cwo [Hyalella azteca]|uniref:Transcription factor cwo n=1 Tax=Hyalella azteca TaxID=294128 RepID=A0A8B7PRJ0_HYAAZ|nr:transcription factor cwo [Hyalella azteca]
MGKEWDPLSHRVIEKRRRDRMNSCLADLNRLIPPHYLKKGRGRVEKTEIIEMAIKYMKHLQQQHDFRDMAPMAPCGAGGLQMDQWTAGYQEAMAKSLQFLVEVEGLFSGDSLCVRLMSYMSKHCKKTLARGGFHPRKVATGNDYHGNGSGNNSNNSNSNNSNNSYNCSNNSSYGYNGNNRNSGYRADNSGSENSYENIKQEDKDNGPTDCLPYNLTNRSSRPIVSPRSQPHVEMGNLGNTFNEFDGIQGGRLRSTVEQTCGSGDSTTYQDHKIERTSSSVPVSGVSAEGSTDLAVERPASEVPLRTMLHHTNAAVCKSVRNEYFSSDNGSNTSSSGGEDNPSRLYKFKSNMKHRFSVDLEHSSVLHPSKKQRRDSGSSSSNYDQYESFGRPIPKGTLCPNGDRETNSPQKENRDRAVASEKFKVKEIARPSSGGNVSTSRMPTLNLVDDAIQTPVPIFAFNQSGSFYVPMSVDASVVASAMSIKPEITPVLHPISIYVNFTPSCLATSITMNPAATPVLRPSFAEHAIPKDSYSSLTCPSDASSEEIKPMFKDGIKHGHVSSLPATSKGSYDTYPSSVNGNQIKDNHEDKSNNYNEMTRTQMKNNRNMSRLSIAKSIQDAARENPGDVFRGHHLPSVPEIPTHDTMSQLCKTRTMREYYSPGHQSQMNGNLGSHSSSATLPLHSTHSSAMTTHTSTSVHAHVPSQLPYNLPPISVFSTSVQSIPTHIPHQLQHSANHTSSRMVRESRNHRELPTPPTSVRDHFEPSLGGMVSSGYPRGTLPWPYHLPARPFKV